MQCEMLDLVGGSGEKPQSPTAPSAPSWDDTEYGAEELEAFAAAPVRELADHYYWLLEVDPLSSNRRAAQLRRVMRARGISLETLGKEGDH